MDIAALIGRTLAALMDPLTAIICLLAGAATRRWFWALAAGIVAAFVVTLLVGALNGYAGQSASDIIGRMLVPSSIAGALFGMAGYGCRLLLGALPRPPADQR
jgi:hypothetical protein